MYLVVLTAQKFYTIVSTYGHLSGIVEYRELGDLRIVNDEDSSLGMVRRKRMIEWKIFSTNSCS